MMQVTKIVPAMTEPVQDALIKNIKRRMTPQPLKIRADIELKCFQFDGVLHIQVRQCCYCLKVHLHLFVLSVVDCLYYSWHGYNVENGVESSITPSQYDVPFSWS